MPQSKRKNNIMMKLLSLIVLATCLLFSTVKSQNPYFIPPLDTGVWVNGVRTFDLLMANATTEFIAGLQTPTSGYNGTFLGPTLYIHKGDSVALNVTNNLGENTTTHWHGLHVPAIMDGGPHQMIANNSTWTATFKMRNQASTFWYHPHHKPAFWQDPDGTGGQVYRGLAAMMIVEDDNSDTLMIPNTYGIDEIPMIIQDRAFDQNGVFLEFINPVLAGRPGDTVMINGVLDAEHQTNAQMIRYRILNASNTRTYYLGLSDNRDFYQIGSDGGFLQSPVLINRLRLSPAERAEIVIDFSGDQGQTIDLMSYASELVQFQPVFIVALQDELDTLDYKIMSFAVGAPTTTPTPVYSLSNTLNFIPVYLESNADVTRSFVLSNGPPMSINGATMDMNVINETIQMGDMEVWTITNTSGSSHPFHIHGEPFQVISRSDGPVLESEQGWKDVVFVTMNQSGNPGWVKIIKPFNDFADTTYPYMYHCHILEHEDRGMMGQYLVVDTNSAQPVAAKELNSVPIEISVYPNPLTEDAVNIRITSGSVELYDLTLINHLGQHIRTLAKAGTLANGSSGFSIDLTGVPSGVYFIEIMNEGSLHHEKLIRL